MKTSDTKAGKSDTQPGPEEKMAKLPPKSFFAKLDSKGHPMG